MGEIEDPTTKLTESTLDKDLVRYKYNAVVACKKRLDYALTNCSFDEIDEAAKNLHRAAFSNWLFRYGLDRTGYYKLMNKEAAKRGLRPPFKSE
jgi:hypothetical protein